MVKYTASILYTASTRVRPSLLVRNHGPGNNVASSPSVMLIVLVCLLASPFVAHAWVTLKTSAYSGIRMQYMRHFACSVPFDVRNSYAMVWYKSGRTTHNGQDQTRQTGGHNTNTFESFH